MDYYNILELQGINKNDIKKYYCLSENNQIILFVELFANQKTCPNRNNSFAKLKEYNNKTIKALPLANKETILDFYLSRYKCKVCNLTNTHKLNTSSNNRILKPVISYIPFIIKNMIDSTIPELKECGKALKKLGSVKSNEVL